MSDTPRTDAACIDAEDYDHCVYAQFARGLEREVNQLRHELQKEKARLDWLLPRQYNHQTRESIDNELPDVP
jgi:flagellar biosynthesis regulator FlaF